MHVVCHHCKSISRIYFFGWKVLFKEICRKGFSTIFFKLCKKLYFNKVVFGLKALKAQSKGVLNRLCCYYGNILHHENDCNLFPLTGHLFDTIIVALTDKEW